MISAQNLSMQFGGFSLFENANFQINPTDKIAIVGNNGSGKTTLLRIIAKQEQHESGNISIPKDFSIGYLPQEFYTLQGKSVFEEVKSSVVQYNKILVREEEIRKKLEQNPNHEEQSKLLLEFGELEYKKELIDFYEIEYRIKKILMGLGFSNADFHKLTGEFSGGWQMRIHLAKLLIAENDLIMLDEPTNHLDIYSLKWLINFLESFKGALLIVSHDKYFVNKITSKTLEIANQKISIYNGKYDKYLVYKEEKEIELLANKKNLGKKRKELEDFIERFRYKATKAKQVQSRIKQLEKFEEVQIDEKAGKIRFRFSESPKSGTIPISVKNLYKSYSDLSVLENVSFDLQKGEKIGFLGINGAGKSTFARILAGIEEFDSGEKYVNPLTEIAYFSQDVTDNLDLESDLLDTMLEENEDFTIPQLRSILGSFLFTDDDIFKKISMLSGGEKSRLTLAKMLLRKSNLLILDEPTNHLDVNSKNVLQQAIIDYSGSVLIVSHDIEFLRPIVGKILDFRERNAKLIYGGIEYYLEKYFDENVNNEINNSEIDKNKKKLQRRNEAEIRQRKYAATKKIKAEIEHIEELISQLEEKIRQIELEMTNPENFSIGEKVKSIQKSYLENKKNLDQQVEKWTELNSEMEKIIKNIEDEYSS